MKRKLLVMLLAALMIVSLVPAYAAETTTITVNGDGTDFVGYRLMDGASGALTMNEKYRDAWYYALTHTWTWNESFTKDKVTTEVILNNVNKEDVTAETVQFLADNLATYLRSNSVAPDCTAADKVFSGVPQGYYLILQTGVADTKYASKAILNTAGQAELEVSVKEDAAIPVLKAYLLNNKFTPDGTTGLVNGMNRFGMAASIPNTVASMAMNGSGTGTYPLVFHVDSTHLKNLDTVDIGVAGSYTIAKTASVFLSVEEADASGNKSVKFYEFDDAAAITDEAGANIPHQTGSSTLKVSVPDLYDLYSKAMAGQADTTYSSEDFYAAYKCGGGWANAANISYTLSAGEKIPLSVAVVWAARTDDDMVPGIVPDNKHSVTLEYPASKYDASITAETSPVVLNAYNMSLKINMVTGTEGSYTDVTGGEYDIYALKLPSTHPTFTNVDDAVKWVGELMADDGNWELQSGMVTNNASNVMIKGLMPYNLFDFNTEPSTWPAPNIYKLVEKTVPTGYNKASDLIFYISTTYTGGTKDSFVFTPTVQKGSAVISELSTKGTFETTILHTNGALMPATGGHGTAMLYGLGAAMMALCVALVIMKARKRSA